MIAARAFSSESAIDLKTSDKTLDVMREIIDGTYKLLSSLKVVTKLQIEELYGKKGNEHEVSNLIRHTDSLPRLTRGIYNKSTTLLRLFNSLVVISFLLIPNNKNYNCII